MPTDTFYRLPEEKKSRLTGAILEELARVPLHEISVNRIIHSAGIPRGSYYQYFTGKDDILSLVLSEYKHCAAEQLRRLHREYGGDWIKVFSGIFSYTLEYGLSQNQRQIFKNLFSEISVREMFLLFSAHDAAPENCVFSGIVYESPTARYRFEILFSITKDALAVAFAEPGRIEEVRNNYEAKLALLKPLLEV